MASPVAVANWFINALTDQESGELVTHLKVQKLLYFAQAWHIMVVGRTLFDEDMQAWAHGPVVPSVWHAFKDHGWNPLPTGGSAEGIDEDSISVLEQVRDAYGTYSAKKLEAITHSERPWIDARGGRAPEARCEEIIPKEAIHAYYKEVFGELEDAEEAA